MGIYLPHLPDLSDQAPVPQFSAGCKSRFFQRGVVPSRGRQDFVQNDLFMLFRQSPPLAAPSPTCSAPTPRPSTKHISAQEICSKKRSGVYWSLQTSTSSTSSLMIICIQDFREWPYSSYLAICSTNPTRLHPKSPSWPGPLQRETV